jgi:hypothetical protein
MIVLTLRNKAPTQFVIKLEHATRATVRLRSYRRREARYCNSSRRGASTTSVFVCQNGGTQKSVTNVVIVYVSVDVRGTNTRARFVEIDFLIWYQIGPNLCTAAVGICSTDVTSRPAYATLPPRKTIKQSPLEPLHTSFVTVL